MTQKPVREMDAIQIRVPDGMKKLVAQRAQANGRSMSAEIVAILADIFDVPDEMELRALKAQEAQFVEEERAMLAQLDVIRHRLASVKAQINRRTRSNLGRLRE